MSKLILRAEIDGEEAAVLEMTTRSQHDSEIVLGAVASFLSAGSGRTRVVDGETGETIHDSGEPEQAVPFTIPGSGEVH